jgi:hypothetical protein
MDQPDVLLLPIELDYITRDPKTGEYGKLGGLMAESQPMPEVEVEADDTRLTANGSLEVDVTIRVRDPLSEITTTNKLNSLTIYVNEEAYETVNNLSSQASGGTVPVWQPHQSQVELTRTITIPQPDPGVVNIRVQTAANAAGNVGWGGVAVTLGRNTTQIHDVAATRSISFTTAASLSAQQVDQITLQVDGQTSATLTETVADSQVFTGTVATANGSRSASLTIQRGLTFSTTQANQVYGNLGLSDGSGNTEQIMGRWLETAVNSRHFNVSTFGEWNDGDRSLLFISGTSPLNSSPENFLEPFVVRVTVPESVATALQDNDGWLALKLFGQDVTLIEKNDFVPDDAPASGMKHLYIASGNDPKLFAILQEFKGTLAPQAAFDEQAFRTELVTRADDKVVFDAVPSIELEVSQSGQQQARMERILLGGPQYASEDPVPGEDNKQTAGYYTKANVLVWFNFLYGKYGHYLLEGYTETGGTIELADMNRALDWDGFKVENWMDLDAQAGRNLKITIDKDHKTAVQAAMALFDAINDANGMLGRYDLKVKMATAFNQAMADDPEGADLYNQLKAHNTQQVKDLGGYTSNAIELGLCIANPGADIAFTANSVIEHAQDGEYVQAGVMATVGVIFTPTLMKAAKRTGKSVVIHTGAETLEVSGKLRDAIIDLTVDMPRYQKMAKLLPHIRSGDIPPDAIEFIYKNSDLLKESRGQLAKNLIAAGKSKPSWFSHEAHHFLVIHPSEELELKFLMAGLDPNDAQFGKWLPLNIHKKLHYAGEGWGPGGPWNYQWIQFFRDHPEASESQILDFLNQEMKPVLNDLIANPSKTLDELNWFYTQ